MLCAIRQKWKCVAALRIPTAVASPIDGIDLGKANRGRTLKRLSTLSTGTPFAPRALMIRQFPCGTGCVADLSELILQMHAEQRFGGTQVILQMQINLSSVLRTMPG